MAFSYDPSLPTLKDKVRFYLGDTNQDNYFLEDEEIDAILSSVGDNLQKALYLSCKAILSKVAKEYSKSLGDARLQLGELFEHYKHVLSELAKGLAQPSYETPPESFFTRATMDINNPYGG